MKTGVTLLSALFGVIFNLGAQQPEKDILLLSGASSIEELDQSEVERFENLSHHPVEINNAGRRRLSECGLFSDYQIASLFDYREKCGDILSLTELSNVDGFGKDFVNAISSFISLHSGARAGQPYAPPAKNFDAQMKAGFNKGSFTYGAKARYEIKDRLCAAISYKDKLSGSVQYSDRKQALDVVCGDYSVRFGQGLFQWNGFSLEGYSSISSFSKRSGGLGQAWTYNPDGYLRGIAAEYCMGDNVSGLFASYSGKEIGAGGYYKRMWLKGQVGIFGIYKGKTMQAVSAEGRYSSDGFDYFGEAGYDFISRSVKAVAGIVRNRAYDFKYAISAKYLQSKWCAAAGIQVKSHFASVEAGNSRIRFIGTSDLNKDGKWSFRFRIVETLKKQENLKSDIRAECFLNAGKWRFQGRSNLVYCKTFAHLHYLEAGFCPEVLEIYCRVTGFDIKNWEDRIYVYERNAPGNFSIPAYYGSGFAASIYARANYKHSKLYARAEFLNSSRHPCQFGVSVSCTIGF